MSKLHNKPVEKDVVLSLQNANKEKENENNHLPQQNTNKERGDENEKSLLSSIENKERGDGDELSSIEKSLLFSMYGSSLYGKFIEKKDVRPPPEPMEIDTDEEMPELE